MRAAIIHKKARIFFLFVTPSPQPPLSGCILCDPPPDVRAIFDIIYYVMAVLCNYCVDNALGATIPQSVAHFSFAHFKTFFTTTFTAV